MPSLKSRSRPLNTVYRETRCISSRVASKDWLPEYSDTSHRKMNSVPSVAMKDGMRAVVTIRPFTTPSSEQPASATIRATSAGSGRPTSMKLNSVLSPTDSVPKM